MAGTSQDSINGSHVHGFGLVPQTSLYHCTRAFPPVSFPGFDAYDAERVESGVDGAQSCERARA